MTSWYSWVSLPAKLAPIAWAHCRNRKVLALPVVEQLNAARNVRFHARLLRAYIITCYGRGKGRNNINQPLTIRVSKSVDEYAWRAKIMLPSQHWTSPKKATKLRAQRSSSYRDSSMKWILLFYVARHKKNVGRWFYSRVRVYPNPNLWICT